VPNNIAAHGSANGLSQRQVRRDPRLTGRIPVLGVIVNTRHVDSIPSLCSEQARPQPPAEALQQSCLPLSLVLTDTKDKSTRRMFPIPSYSRRKHAGDNAEMLKWEQGKETHGSHGASVGRNQSVRCLLFVIRSLLSGDQGKRPRKTRLGPVVVRMDTNGERRRGPRNTVILSRRSLEAERQAKTDPGRVGRPRPVVRPAEVQPEQLRQTTECAENKGSTARNYRGANPDSELSNHEAHPPAPARSA
jgi:hypothetical protein